MLESMLLTLWLMSASLPEGCAVTGTVFHSTEQTFALLRSDCLIDIQRHDRWIIMTSPRWVVAVEIPPTFGKGQVTYSSVSPWPRYVAGHLMREYILVALGHGTAGRFAHRRGLCHSYNPG